MSLFKLKLGAREGSIGKTGNSLYQRHVRQLRAARPAKARKILLASTWRPWSSKTSRDLFFALLWCAAVTWLPPHLDRHATVRKVAHTVPSRQDEKIQLVQVTMLRAPDGMAGSTAGHPPPKFLLQTVPNRSPVSWFWRPGCCKSFSSSHWLAVGPRRACATTRPPRPTLQSGLAMGNKKLVTPLLHASLDHPSSPCIHTKYF